MVKNQFFEKKGPFLLKDIIEIISSTNNPSINDTIKIESFESLNVAGSADLTFLNSNKYQKLKILSF